MPTIEEAFAHCEKLTRAHYENFPVGSLLVPKEKRKYIWAIYAFARTADDFADEGRHARETADDLKKRLDQLDDWEYKLVQASRGTADDPVFTAVAETIRAIETPVQLLKDLLTAYRMDVKQNRYQTFEELHYYCKHSANPVGRLVLHTMGYRDEELNRYSDKICTALQLANFWQDIEIDLAKNRVYLPQEEMKKFHVTEGDLQAKICNRAFRTLLKYCMDRTAVLFDEGLPLTEKVRGDLRWEMKLTWLGGTTILKKINASECDIYRARPEIGLLDKIWLLARSVLPIPLKPMRGI